MPSLSRAGRDLRSVTNLRYFRIFYQTYADRSPEIRHEPRDEWVLGDTGQKHHGASDVSADLALAASPADPLRGFASGLLACPQEGMMWPLSPRRSNQI